MREAVTPLLVTNWFLAWANQSLTRHIQSWGSLHETASRDMASANWAEERERERERERDRTGPVRVIFSKNGSNTMTSYPSYPLSLISHMSHILLSHISNIRTNKWTNNRIVCSSKVPKLCLPNFNVLNQLVICPSSQFFVPIGQWWTSTIEPVFLLRWEFIKEFKKVRKKEKKIDQESDQEKKLERKQEIDQENKKTTKKKRKKLSFFLDHFLGRVLFLFFFLVFLLSWILL